MMRSIRCLAAAAVVAVTPLTAQTPTAPKLTGWAEASFTLADHLVGRLYDRFEGEFMLNAFGLTFDKAYDPRRRSTGFHAQTIFGQNATVIQSAGLSLGAQGDLTQLYVTLNLPTSSGHGVQLKVGKIPSLMGLEVIETQANPNWSEGLQFIYVENFTATGLGVDTKFSDRVDAQFRVINGWDVVQDNNDRMSLMARIGFSPNDRTSIAFLGYWGPEAAPQDNRSGAEVLVSHKFGKTSLWVQGDIGSEEGIDANWAALGVWLARDLSSTVNVALRADFLNDADGARTSLVLGFPPHSGQDLFSVTGTLNIRAWPNALVRPELRFDSSNLGAFGGAFGGEETQVSLALSITYLF